MQEMKLSVRPKPRHGCRATARPNLGVALVYFESYSAENVTRDLGLHFRWHSKATLPLSENLAFTVVMWSILWEPPKLKLFLSVENLCVISATTSVPLWGVIEWTYDALRAFPFSILHKSEFQKEQWVILKNLFFRKKRFVIKYFEEKHSQWKWASVWVYTGN